MDSPWNSLEVAKLVISAITPLLVFVLGISITRSLKNAEHATGLRSEIYKTIGSDLNDIYAYLSFVGGWKELCPSDVIARKRAVDRAMYMYKPFFTPELFKTYLEFMDQAFRVYGAPGQDARIRTDIETHDGNRRLHGRQPWLPQWEQCFTKERNKAAQREAYELFLEQLARDLKV